ncbi:aspartyl/asparaginyl beta-hydroxylase domain-containing protein [Hirschia maritima]|uniref:aspartyl/asparaginyl beta-hydroxylase domain-containing protein n=1 Tax=Hirschia maritima TaxID=1121961 RepID=UPI00036DA813|nr:aspartyl/asparaginyl beta-hydroxylase domain-containing protein [Hirschia maritima]
MNSIRPNASAQQIAQTGFQLFRSGNYTDARNHLELAIQKGFIHPDSYVVLSHCHRNLNDIQNALKAVETALSAAPKHMRALLAKGELLELQQDLDEAVRFYKSAISVAPSPDEIPADIRPNFSKAFELIESQAQKHEQNLLRFLPSKKETLSQSKRFAESIEILLGKAKPYFQQPTRFFFPGLAQKAVYSRDEFDWVKELEDQTANIKKELLSLIQDQNNLAPYVQADDKDLILRDNKLINNSDWSACYLWKNGKLQEDMAEKCPQTVSALSSLPLDFLENQTPSILFSVLKPGTHIPPHHGMLNTRLICHLPLIVPPNCGIRVGNEHINWEEGKVIIFDDSIEHEAWNNSQETRVVLLFEIWHPELTENEKALIQQTFLAINAAKS